jgi:predicted nucleic acid-binding protein
MQERGLFVKYARIVDDGEAEALAIAKARGVLLLTDDRAAIRLASDVGIAVETTLDLLESWASNRPAERVSAALKSFAARAQYAPPRGHRLRQWFLSRT